MKAGISAICAAGVMGCGLIAFAQEAGQQPKPAPSTAPAQQISVTGCVQREADYRRTRDAGRGGVAGTGVGAGNEFILADVAMAARPGSDPTSPTGTSGTLASGATAYELTGPNEGKVAEYVGRRVEISGMVKAAETAGGTPTGGATAGQPPSGVDVASKDLKLRELEVSSVREATGSCPAAK